MPDPPPLSSQSPAPSEPSPDAENPRGPLGWLVIKYCANGGLSIDTVEGALYDEQVHSALAESKTLGEFWLALPPETRRELAEFFFKALFEARFGEIDEEDLSDTRADGVYKDCESPDYWATDQTPFDAGQIPGFGDGDWPRWQQQALDDVLPRDLLSQFATKKHSVHNGPFWFIPHESAPELTEALRRRGYRVEEASFLRGW
jgi:hypothetical protein